MQRNRRLVTVAFIIPPFFFSQSLFIYMSGVALFLSPGICTTQDVDLLFKHMNNARYLRELDFARFHYYDRSGIYSVIVKRGCGAVQGASSTRYRRAIPIFTPFKVVTKVNNEFSYILAAFLYITCSVFIADLLGGQTLLPGASIHQFDR